MKLGLLREVLDRHRLEIASLAYYPNNLHPVPAERRSANADMEIDRDGLYRNGTVSLGMGWQVPRLPGLGEVRWDRFVAALSRAGYDGVISIENEDRAFEGTEEP